MGNYGGALCAVCLREATSDKLFDQSSTASLHTEPKLLDVAGAAASLPDLPLAAGGGAGSALTQM